MNFKKWMTEQPDTDYIGKVAIFYIPENKLTKPVRKKLHDFFVKNYNAYTHEVSKIQGYWVKQNKLIKDKHERYEIAFDGEQNLKKFVGFLSELCDIIEEDSIYLIVGDESYLVKPKKN